MKNLAVIYALGKGVPQSYTEAAKYYRQAAGRGDFQALLMADKLTHLQVLEKQKAQTLAAIPAAANALRPQPAAVNAARAQAPSRPLVYRPVEAPIFRFSSSVREERFSSFGGPSGGYRPTVSHFGGGHFGRR